jgi:hypothetical protein
LSIAVQKPGNPHFPMDGIYSRLIGFDLRR